MARFPHLKFSENIIGKARFYGGGTSNPRSERNKNNRQEHSQDLLSKTSGINTDWLNHITERMDLQLAPLDEHTQPIYLQVNPDLFADVKFDLLNFGIEIISEEEDGYIIGASLDNLRSLEEKIRGFVHVEPGSAGVANLWEIIVGNREEWKPQHILSPELLAKWSTVEESIIYNLEVSIAFDKPIKVTLNPNSSRYLSQQAKFNRLLEERDVRMLERQEHFEEFINFYNGELRSSIIELEDSFGCKISINGKGLKDLVVNYPFVFEVCEAEDIDGTIDSESTTTENNIEILPPDEDSVEVGIIDSGIMENHKYLEAAIKAQNSKSYLINDADVSDKVLAGGHGTKVAGAALFPFGISSLTNTTYRLPFFVRNLRVLNDRNYLEHPLPAELMQKIIEENSDCGIFNLSINSKAPCRTKHMSMWAAMLDNLIHKKDILFIVSVGNITKDAIRYFIQNKNPYPNYLTQPECRLANPAQSSFSIVVGSINHLSLNNEDWESLGIENEISAFSRIGQGIWGHIKPDVVEYGGGLQISKNGLNHISQRDTAIELIRSNYHGGGAINKESIGTSFAAPKVSHVVAELRKLYPQENINLIRALLIQGARLPGYFFKNPTLLSIKHFGYGIPSLHRVTENTDHRITFYNSNYIKADQGQIYSLKLPEAMRGQGDEFEILIEVTLAFTAKNRRTRQKTKSYLSTWLEWKCSKLEKDSYEKFKNRTLSEIDGEKVENTNDNSANVIGWKIRERQDWGIDGINRNNSTLQKDWAILKSYELPEELHLAVVAHKGWDSTHEPIPYAIAVSIEILGADIPIYESIRVENEIEIPV